MTTHQNPTRPFVRPTGAVICMLALIGCSKVPENPPPSCDTDACTVAEGEHLRTVVDASDDERWVYFDLDTGTAIEPSDPTDDLTWDLAFRRVVIQSNGGVSGTGGVEVAVLEETTLEDVERAPAEGWQQDQAGDGSDRDPGGTVFNEDTWYVYDLITHTLDPVPGRVYVVRTTDGAAYRLRLDAYYDGEANSGQVSFTWSAVAAF